MWNVPGKERLGTASPTGGDPRLDLPSWDGFSCGLWSVEGLLSPQGHFPTSPIPPQIGVLPPTLASVWGGLPGAPWPLLPLLPPPYLCPGLRGAFCLFFFFFIWEFLFCPLRPFVFKDAAGQTGREEVCLPIRLRGLRRGRLGRVETSCNTVLPGRWPEDRAIAEAG